MTYIIDFFNVFSDYREMHYKRTGVDFHKIKHKTLKIDTINFFDLFFKDYIKVASISPNDTQFIFVMKKIFDYEEILMSIIEKYSSIDLKFVIITDRYKNTLVEQNKDDFICQYLLTVHEDSVLISNDKYNNRQDYTNLFLDMHRINIQIMHTGINSCTFYIITSRIVNLINYIKFNRKSIAKKNFEKCLFK